MNKLAPYMKALTGAIVAGLTALIPALNDDRLTSGEGAGIALAFFAALGVVWAVPNRDPKAQHQAESVQPPNARGAVDQTFLIVFAVIGILALVWILLGRA